MSGWTVIRDESRRRDVRRRVVADLPRVSRRDTRGVHVQLVVRQVRDDGRETWSRAALGLEVWVLGRLVPIASVTVLATEIDALEDAIAEVRRINAPNGASEEHGEDR